MLIFEHPNTTWVLRGPEPMRTDTAPMQMGAKKSPPRRQSFFRDHLSPL